MSSISFDNKIFANELKLVNVTYDFKVSDPFTKSKFLASHLSSKHK